jgi:hypothetical protein
MNATFTEEEPETLNFKTLQASGISYTDVEVIMEIEYDKSDRKDYKLSSKNSTIKIINKESKLIGKHKQLKSTKNTKEEEITKYSSLDKFRLIEFKKIL